MVSKVTIISFFFNHQKDQLDSNADQLIEGEASWPPRLVPTTALQTAHISSWFLFRTLRLNLHWNFSSKYFLHLEQKFSNEA